RAGFRHLAEHLTYRQDQELIDSAVRGIISALKAGEKCNVEPELKARGMKS
ncbi:hypothetical protein scyTo_0025203, partial [Scyliorhinus torazame]|nr:hypothetical protein [Scyliorhinus torazame]